MDDPWTGVLTSTWADVKTSLVVCLAEFKQKKYCFQMVHFYGRSQKAMWSSNIVVYGLGRKFKQYLTHSPAYPKFFTLSKDAYNKWTEQNSNVSSK